PEAVPACEGRVALLLRIAKSETTPTVVPWLDDIVSKRGVKVARAKVAPLRRDTRETAKCADVLITEFSAFLPDIVSKIVPGETETVALRRRGTSIESVSIAEKTAARRRLGSACVHLFFELQVIEARIVAVGGKKLGVATFLDDPAVDDDADAVR